MALNPQQIRFLRDYLSLPVAERNALTRAVSSGSPEQSAQEALLDFQRRKDKVLDELKKIAGGPGGDKIKKRFEEVVADAVKIVGAVKKDDFAALTTKAKEQFARLEQFKNQARDEVKAVKEYAKKKGATDTLFQALKAAADSVKLTDDAVKKFYEPVAMKIEEAKKAADNGYFSIAIEELKLAESGQRENLSKVTDYAAKKTKFETDLSKAKELQKKLASDTAVLGVKYGETVRKPLDELLKQAEASIAPSSWDYAKGCDLLGKVPALKKNVEKELAEYAQLEKLKNEGVEKAKKTYETDLKAKDSKGDPARFKELIEQDLIVDKAQWKKDTKDFASQHKLSDAEVFAIRSYTSNNYFYINPATANQKDNEAYDTDLMDDRFWTNPQLFDRLPQKFKDQVNQLKAKVKQEQTDLAAFINRTKDEKKLEELIKQSKDETEKLKLSSIKALLKETDAKKKDELRSALDKRIEEQIKGDLQRDLYQEGALHAGMVAEVFKKLPTIGADATGKPDATKTQLFRGETLGVAQFDQKFSKGKTIAVENFTSFSADKSVADNFKGGAGAGKVSVCMIAEIWSARDVKALSQFPEDERLVPPGASLTVKALEALQPDTTWKAIDKVDRAGGSVKVYLEELSSAATKEFLQKRAQGYKK